MGKPWPGNEYSYFYGLHIKIRKILKNGIGRDLSSHVLTVASRRKNEVTCSLYSESTELQTVVDLSLKQFTSAAEMTKDILSESWKENCNQDTWTHGRKTDANGWFLKGTTTAFKTTNRQEWFGLKEKEALHGGRYGQAIGPDQSFVYISKPSCSSLFCEHTKRKPISNWYPHIAKCCSKRKLVETYANLRKLTQTYVRKFTEKQYLCTTKRTQAVHNGR